MGPSFLPLFLHRRPPRGRRHPPALAGRPFQPAYPVHGAAVPPRLTPRRRALCCRCKHRSRACPHAFRPHPKREREARSPEAPQGHRMPPRRRRNQDAMSIAKPDPASLDDRRETEHFRLNMLVGFKRQLPDSDPVETREWLEALDGVVETQGRERADFLLRRVLKRARQLHVGLPGLVQSRYINTISPEQEPPFPGDEEMEKRIRRIIRWNAAAMVVRANAKFQGLGGPAAPARREEGTAQPPHPPWNRRGKGRGGDGEVRGAGRPPLPLRVGGEPL